MQMMSCHKITILTDFVDRIFPIELQIKDTTYIDRSAASYLDIHLVIDSESQLITKLYDHFNLPMVNFPFICRNISAGPKYGVYISQLIQHSRASGSFHYFLDRRSYFLSHSDL